LFSLLLHNEIGVFFLENQQGRAPTVGLIKIKQKRYWVAHETKKRDRKKIRDTKNTKQDCLCREILDYLTQD
jgi:hypothetical protein